MNRRNIDLTEHAMNRIKERLAEDKSIEDILETLNSCCAEGFKLKMRGDDDAEQFKIYIPNLGGVFHIKAEKGWVALSFYYHSPEEFGSEIKVKYKYIGKK